MNTSYFGNKALPPGVNAVRISRGAPRWKVPYKIAGKIECLMPTQEMRALEHDEFRARYLAALDALGVEAIRAALAPFGESAVLMCFESLKDGTWCHRRMFAEWWQAKTGEAIPEL